MSAVLCGLDVHKETTYDTILGQDGEVITQRRMKNEEILVFLEPLNVEGVAMEASTYIIPMYRRLVEEGYDVTVNHQKKTGYIAAAESNPTGWTLRRAPITTTLISARLCREGKKLRARAPMRRGVRREKL